MGLYHIVKIASHHVDKNSQVENRRTKYSILASTMSEIGELAEEVMIDQGQSYKMAGSDGIVGEAVDSILCLLDLIHVVDPELTEAELNELAAAKCKKWMDKTTMVGSPAGNQSS